MTYEIDWPQTLEFLKVFLSWPPLAALAAVAFALRFGKEIAIFLSNGRLKPPGYDPLPAPVQPVPAESRQDGEAPAEETPKEVDGTPAPTQDAPPEAEEAERPNGELVNALINARQRVDEYRFLNNLLILDTQLLLNTLTERGAITRLDYNSLRPDLPAANKTNMLTVLYQQGLVSIDENFIHVTEKGLRYSSWPERLVWVDTLISINEGDGFNAFEPRMKFHGRGYSGRAPPRPLPAHVAGLIVPKDPPEA